MSNSGSEKYIVKSILQAVDSNGEPDVTVLELTLPEIARDVQIDELELNPAYEFYADTDEPLFVSDYKDTTGDMVHQDYYVRHRDRSPLTMDELEQLARLVDNSAQSHIGEVMNPKDKVQLYRRLLRKAEAQLRQAGPYADEDGPIPIANPAEFKDRFGNVRRLFYMTFGVYGWDKVYVWADSAESAIEQGAQWLLDVGDPSTLSGVLYTDTDMADIYQEAKQELGPNATEEELMEYAESDLTYTESGYLSDWTINDVYDEELQKVYERCAAGEGEDRAVWEDEDDYETRFERHFGRQAAVHRTASAPPDDVLQKLQAAAQAALLAKQAVWGLVEDPAGRGSGADPDGIRGIYDNAVRATKLLQENVRDLQEVYDLDLLLERLQ